MASIRPPKPKEGVTPRQLLEFIQIGTGKDFDRAKYFNFMKKEGWATAVQIRQLMEELIGFPPDYLHATSPKTTFSNSIDGRVIRARIRDNLQQHLPFLQRYIDEERESGLEEVADQAAAYIRHMAEEYHPDRTGELDITSDPKIFCDAPSLVLMAFNDEELKRTKFEAARQLVLMLFFGQLKPHRKEKYSHNKALQYMMRIINKRIIQLPEGERMGTFYWRQLISRHNRDDFSAQSAELIDPENETESDCDDPNLIRRITRLGCRRTIVRDKKGIEREVFFFMEARNKDNESRLTKKLRENHRIDEGDTDRSGFQFVFKNKQDWEDYFDMFKNEILSEIQENLEEKLRNTENEDEIAVIESRLANMETSVFISEYKDTMDGGDFSGSSKASSSKLKICKFKMLVTRANGMQHLYEFQVFLPDGFADYRFGKETSWEKYNNCRTFDKKEGVDQLLFPEEFFGIDPNEACAEALERIHRNIWGNDASNPPPVKKEGSRQQKGKAKKP